MATEELELGVSAPAASERTVSSSSTGVLSWRVLLTVGSVSWVQVLAGEEQADGRGLPGRGEGSRDTTDSDRMKSGPLIGPSSCARHCAIHHSGFSADSHDTTVSFPHQRRKENRFRAKVGIWVCLIPTPGGETPTLRNAKRQ